MIRRKNSAENMQNCSNCGGKCDKSTRSKTATKSNQVETSRSAGKRSRSASTRAKSSTRSKTRK